MAVVGERESLHAELALAVDLLMDGISRKARVLAEDFGGTAGGGEQDTGLLEAVKRADERTHHARLTCTRVAAEDESLARVAGHKEGTEGLEQALFLFVRLPRQFRLNTRYNEVRQHNLSRKKLK